VEGEWKWITNDSFNYSDWDLQEPNNGKITLFGGFEACVYENYSIIFNKNGNFKWRDVQNVDSRLFIMEIGKNINNKVKK